MSWVAVGVGVGSLVVGAYGANKSAGAAGSAANAQAAAANQANQTQLSIFNQQRSDNEPFRQAGLTGLNEYLAMLGLSGVSTAPGQGMTAAQWYLQQNPDVAADPYWGANPMLHYQQHGQGEGRTWETPAQPAAQAQQPVNQQAAFDKFRNTPGYQFGLDEGFTQIQRGAAARSGLNSGAAMKALYKFGQGYSDQQGYTPYMNKLASLWGGAQTANAQNASAGQNYANNVGQNTMAAGQARASGIIGAQNAWNNFYGQAANTAGQLAGYYAGAR